MFSRKQKTNQEIEISTTPVSVAVDMGTNFNQFLAKMNLLIVNLSELVLANKLFFSISFDEDGDKELITETEGRLKAGKTTNTKASASFLIDAILFSDSSTLYFWFWLNDGSATINDLTITFEED